MTENPSAGPNPADALPYQDRAGVRRVDPTLRIASQAVYVPDSLARKYPGAPKPWAWQYVVSSRTRSVVPRTGVICRPQPLTFGGLRRWTRLILPIRASRSDLWEKAMHDNRETDLVMRRREVLALLGAAGTLMLAGRTYAEAGSASYDDMPACVVTPEQTEGPYFVDEGLNRSDIRLDPADGSVRAGVPLTLGLRISSISGAACVPLVAAVVDVWHCDAAGVYSDVADPKFNTVGKKFLRGYQVTDINGGVRFTTIYPGWYRGRTVHIHFKVRAKAKSGQSYEHTSQLYFDDAITDRVHAHEPYASRGHRTVKNDADAIFRDAGSQLMLAPVERDSGYAATFDVGLQMP